MVPMTTAKPMTAPMLITPADNDDHVLAAVMKVLEIARYARVADAREWPAWYYLARTGPPQHARKG
eukprot:3937300-Pyramimonas_sp.AAC.1